MARNCSGCGAELFGGQRFCRVCGRPTADLEGNDSPTQVMPPSAVAPDPSSEYGAGARGSTGSTGHSQGITAPTSAHTGPVPQYMRTEYRPGPPAPYYQPPTKGGSRWGWIIAFIAIGLFSVVMMAVLMVSRAARHIRDDVKKNIASSVRGNAGRAPGDQDFGEDNAVTSGSSTVITRTFPLDTDATFVVNNTNGDLTVEGWDQPQAEVTITKTGGTADMREQAKVVFNGDEDKMTVKTLAGAPSGISVKYLLKLPRGMEQITLHGVNSTVSISNVGGNVSIETVNGSVHLSDLKDGVHAKTVNGSIEAAFDAVEGDDPLDFQSTNGSITLQFKSGLDASLSAQVGRGSISIDNDFGITPEKSLMGQRASGNIGDGGRSLSVATVNGSITITK
jgi:hypothetical protein